MAVLRRLSGNSPVAADLQPDAEFLEACLEQGKAAKSQDEPGGRPRHQRAATAAADDEARPTVNEQPQPEERPQPAATTDARTLTSVGAPNPETPPTFHPRPIEETEPVADMTLSDDLTDSAQASDELTMLRARAAELQAALEAMQAPEQPTASAKSASVVQMPPAEAAAPPEPAEKPEPKAPPVEATPVATAEADGAVRRPSRAFEWSSDDDAEPLIEVPAPGARHQVDSDVDRRLGYERELTVEAEEARHEFETARAEAVSSQEAVAIAEERRASMEARVASMRAALDAAEAEMAALAEEHAPLWASFAKAIQRQSRAASRLAVLQQTIGENRRQAEKLRADVASESASADRWLDPNFRVAAGDRRLR